MRVPGAEAAFCAVYAGVCGAAVRCSAEGVSGSGGGAFGGFRAGEDGLHLLCGGLDAALDRSADDSVGGDIATAAGKHWAAGRRDSGAARTCVNSGIDGYSYAVRHSSWVSADAVF